MTESRIRKLIGNAHFVAPGDGSLVTENCRGFFVVIECKLCAVPIDFIVWFIVDGDMRPDLLRSARKGRIHDPLCPSCGHVNHLESHILLLRRNEEPALLFSPAQSSSGSSHGREIASLVAKLQRQMEDGWDEQWVNEGGRRVVAEVDRCFLPLLLEKA